MFKILITDDSIVYRSAITQALSTSKLELEITTASNGKICLTKFQNSKFDLVITDLEMPEMNGIEVIKSIRETNKSVPIIVYSSLTLKGAEKTFEALAAGATDFSTKVENVGDIDEGIKKIQMELLPKVEGILRGFQAKQKKEFSPSKLNDLILTTFRPSLIAIGSSTGGPEALKNIFRNINCEIKVPLVIVQHMPKLFTKKLAEDLDKLTPIKFKEAEENEILVPNTAYIAPGDFHMTIKDVAGKKVVKLNQEEKVCFVRPSVDVLYDSIAPLYPGKILSFILTGMGSDGMNGSQTLRQKDCPVIIQDRESSVVWGMPGAIAEKNIQTNIMSLKDIAQTIKDLAGIR